MTTPTTPVLHMVCGKIGAGKSTLTQALAREAATVRISEDDWLATLYPGEIRELADYVRCASRLKQVLGEHVAALLRAGVSVVLDFPANTVAHRAWARGLFEGTGAAHRLHFLDVPDVVCKARLRERNRSGEHPFETSDAQFDLITRHFVAPGAQEGFDVVRHGWLSSGAMHIEQARPDEAATIAAVLNEAAQWQTVNGQPFWSATDIALERIQAHADAGAYFIAREGNTVAAVVRLDLDDPLFWPEIEAGSTLYVHKLAVARIAAGRGVPKALLDFARERARQLGRPWLRLDCVADRAPLRALYEGYGFVLRDVVHKADRSFARYELAVT